MDWHSRVARSVQRQTGHARAVAPATALAALVVTQVLLSGAARADLALETESARLLPRGRFQFSGAFEFQTASEGQEYAVPLAFEYGIMDRLELMVEPVAFTSIQPNNGPSASGFGDIEVTLTYLILDEKPAVPAIAIAGEVKAPTANDPLIGSEEWDYRIYGVASKRFGDFDVHFNLGYTFIGQPAGVETQNPIDLALGVEWFVHPKFDLLAEVTYVGSSLNSGGSGEAPDVGLPGQAEHTAEIAGEETVGTVGIRYHLKRDFDVFGTVSYDNNDATLLRTGVTLRF